MEVTLSSFVRDYDSKDINEHLFNNSFPLLNSKELNFIMDKYTQFKDLSSTDISHYRKRFKDICEAELINKSNEFPDSHSRLEFIRNNDYKEQFSKTIKIDSFDEAKDRDDDPLNPSGIKSSLKFINDASPIGEYINGQVISVSARPGAGKSLFLMSESASACISGKKVHYLAAGDLKPSDFLMRMSSQILKVPIDEVYMNAKEYIEQAAKILNGNFKFSCVPAQSVTASEYVNYMLSSPDDYDMYVVDYDTNIAPGSDTSRP
jgi:hypothetical protein